jgi:hypothetical protein
MKQIICHTLFAHLPPSKNTRWKRLRRVVQAVAAFGAECQFPSGLQRIIVSKTSRLGSGTVSTLALLSIAIGQVALSQEPTWTERGPGRGREGPIVDNITEGITEALQTPLNLLPILGIVSRSNPASGAVNAIAFSSDANLLYAGTVNGGIWRANWPSSAQSPRSLGWTPLTDQMLPGLSINSLAISPSNPNRLFAGTGSTSSHVLDGSPGFGVARSTDGGSTWEVFASDTFAGKRINSIVPTGLNAAGNAAGMAGSDDEVVLAATWYGASKTDGGVYRSTDGGKTFTRMSDGSLQGLSLPPGSMSVGLPWGGVSSLVVDPTNRNRVYAAVTTAYGTIGNAGIYRSEDGGFNWTAAVTLYTGTTPVDFVTGLSSSLRILLAVGERTGTLFAMVLVDAFNPDTTKAGKLYGVFQSTNYGDGMWTSLGQPSPTIFPGLQAKLHGAIAAHPTNPNVVFISGDRQVGPFPNVNGCTTFSANTFRGDASLLPANQWQNVVGNGANGTSPHADCRSLVFGANGDLLAGTDGGIYLLDNPDIPASRTWFSLNLNLGCTEFVSVAYDPLINVVFGGAQDVGIVYQVLPTRLFRLPFGPLEQRSWKTLRGGDGGVVAVDSSSANLTFTLRYGCNEFLSNFSRWFFALSSQNGAVPISRQDVPLNITSGPGKGMTIQNFDKQIQFYNPYVLNAITPRRMLIGTKYLYESMDFGESLTNLLPTQTAENITSLAYGSRQNGKEMPDAFYAGTSSSFDHGAIILHRKLLSDPVTTLNTYQSQGGSGVRSLVMDPQNFQNVYVVDDHSQVWASIDEAQTWTNITANLVPTLTSDVRCIEIFSPDTMTQHSVLIVGGLGGVWQMQSPGSGSSWIPLSSGLPHALFNDLHYNGMKDVLVAGSLGRGAWTLTNFFRGFGGLPLAQAPMQ